MGWECDGLRWDGDRWEVKIFKQKWPKLSSIMLTKKNTLNLKDFR